MSFAVHKIFSQGCSPYKERGGAQQEEVHQLPLAHVRHAVRGDAAGHAGDVPRDALPAEAQALDGLAQRACTGPAELRANMFSASITNPALSHTEITAAGRREGWLPG